MVEREGWNGRGAVKKGKDQSPKKNKGYRTALVGGRLGIGPKRQIRSFWNSAKTQPRAEQR